MQFMDIWNLWHHILFCTRCCVYFYDKCLAKIQIQCRAFFFFVHWRDQTVVPGSWVMYSMKSIENIWQIWDNLIESETKFSEFLWRMPAKLNDVRRRNWCMMLLWSLWRCRNCEVCEGTRNSCSNIHEGISYISTTATSKSATFWPRWAGTES